MKYAGINSIDVCNGAGIRVSLYVSGCSRRCKGCFNEKTWDFNYGDEYTLDVENSILDKLNDDKIAGLTVLGGEPLHPSNINTVYGLLSKVKTKYTNKNIWVYTGYTYEYIKDNYAGVLNCIDILVDGPYEEDKHDSSLAFRGSSNQRIIDVKKSLEQNNIVLYK